MGLLKKITGGAKKLVRKVVPKEVAGIMTAAAPFVAPYSLPAAAALSIGGQLRTGQGRINPILTGMSLLPGIRFQGGQGLGAFKPTGFTRFGPNNFGSGITSRQLLFGGPGAGQSGKLGAFGDKAEGFLFGNPELQAMGNEADGMLSLKDPTQGLLGFGGEYGTGGSLISTMKDGAPVISKTKIGAAAAAGLTLSQTQAQIADEGEELGLGGSELAALQAEAAEMWKDFDTTAFRPKVTAAIGGLMRKNLAMGSLMDDTLKKTDEGAESLMPEVKYNAKDFMIEQFQETGYPPRILGEGFQGDEKIFVIETPRGGTMMITQEDYITNFGKINKAEGGRIGYAVGSDGPVLPEDPTKPVNPFAPKPTGPVLPDKAEAGSMELLNDLAKQLFGKPLDQLDDRQKEMIMSFMKPKAQQGGLMRTNYALGTKPTNEESGLGGLPIEADMRYSGGFMPYGAKEKADDVPARLSKNEFVFTADAVRAAGGGSIQKGAQKMYNSMKQLESMGRSVA